ncbi:polysaccharide biosynthesis protein [Phycicoccus sp. CSK15P-2]|uniref:polysaccharide biosynthesis protein n=1 Tax=Phycicoccus sp. CSK15P-2 TaxID=2807627 RepID=UPI00194EE7FB|nr:polysaccharide biosynthesis protein [Phycicoccus sp. CSK15P-2]MBM6403493.1 polysaccharide biosynthesis protein [Phycicoccus sp. CSK15P-2]
MLLDIAVLVVIILVLAIARYDLVAAEVNRRGLVIAVGLAAAVYTTTYGLLVNRRFRWGSPDELVGLALVVAVLMAALTTASVSTAPTVLPATVALTAPPCASSAWLGMRYLARQYHRARRRRSRRDARRAVVVGAGWGGQQAVSMMLDDPVSSLTPVGVVDDDPRKQSLSISGVRVRGRIVDLPSVCTALDADVVLLAIPSAAAPLVERVVDLADASDTELMVLPSFDEMLAVHRLDHDSEASGPKTDRSSSDAVDVTPRAAFRSVHIEDLLGRGVADIDNAGIEQYLRGRVVLVTGAGGSIGSQLCREITAFGPSRLVMTDRDDSLLHGVQLSVDGRGLLDSDDIVLGDLRDRTFVRTLVHEHRPDVVFHAAAVKHLTLAERFPAEAFLTNVAATADLLAACVEAGVSRFVNISTDKAADPSSTLGYSKRVTERLAATFGTRSGVDARYISVRFGNVLGSRGSALATFAAQLSAGLPLTITSPEMTRYFMTVHEATQLVLQAAVHGHTGEGLVLDMGKPHNIEDLARRFAGLQGYPPPVIRYTGVRPGEKLEERVLAKDEPDTRPFHPLVTHVPMPVLHTSSLDEIERIRSAIVRGRTPDVSGALRVLSASESPVGGDSRPIPSGRA